MPLSHFSLQKAKPADKPYKISDGGGLFVLIQPNGSKLWRMKYQLLGIERSLSFGSYPAISLADARMNRDEARKLLATGTDPSTQKKQDKLAAETAAKCTFGMLPTDTSPILKPMVQRPRPSKKTGRCWRIWPNQLPPARLPTSPPPSLLIC